MPLTVRTFRSGAVDFLEQFLEKPYDAEGLLSRIYEALALDARHRQEEAKIASFKVRLTRLMPREREVMAFMVVDKSCKETAAALRLSYRTVEAHRCRVMRKIEKAHSLVDLATLVVLMDS